MSGVGFHSSPQASDYLPSIRLPSSTLQPKLRGHRRSYRRCTRAHAVPADQFDNVTRYIKIAATLPRKCVRDVAFKVKALGYPSGQPAASKRMKIEPYKTQASRRQPPRSWRRRD
ncbi:hypothetical protein GQ600_20892 [Phytophthora cactorum]|nr:hypothetical protein GQ600_20892 [Phytophthora cactorum]